MKQILITIDDDVWAEIRSAVTTRMLCSGSHGSLDQFGIVIIKAIDEGLEKKHISFKKPDSGVDK